MIQYVYDKNNRELIMVSYIQKIIKCKTWYMCWKCWKQCDKIKDKSIYSNLLYE